MTDNDDLEASPSSANQPIQIQNIRIEPSSGSEMQVISISEQINEAIQLVRKVSMYAGFFYTGLVILLSVLAVILLAPVAIGFLDQHSPILMMTARILISLLAFGLGVGAWIILLSHWRINDGMETAEILIDDIRDQALIQMQAARFNLEDLTERLKFPQEAQAAGPLEYIEMAKQIGPLLSLLMAKEKSILTIGVEGLKFFQLLKKVLNK